MLSKAGDESQHRLRCFVQCRPPFGDDISTIQRSCLPRLDSQRQRAGLYLVPGQILQGDPSAAGQGLAEAQYNLGVLYFNGSGITKDRQKAKEWYQKACNNGYQKACDDYRRVTEQPN